VAFFPDPESVDATGLVAVGGDLRPARLLEAYCLGIYPWYGEEYPILWWSPDPRAIFEMDGLHISRRLRRAIGSGRFTLTINQAFADVVRGCADREEGTWITPDMFMAYRSLHRLGYAHSVEAWYQGKLAGGVYGVAIGGFFAGESMFHCVTDASKVALAFLMNRLRERGYRLFDIQSLTDHTRTLGAVEIPRKDYLTRLRTALQVEARFVD
jgi:leucyl/phenylalanyl-tRNA--protein transferase